jgi:hypothetical protein
MAYVVAAVWTAKEVAAEDSAALDDAVRRCRRRGSRTVLRQPLVRPPVIGEGPLRRQHAREVTLAHDEQLIEHLLAHRPDPAFGSESNAERSRPRFRRARPSSPTLWL